MRNMVAPVRRYERIVPDYRRDQGRPKESPNEVTRHDLRTLRLTKDMAQDRRL